MAGEALCGFEAVDAGGMGWHEDCQGIVHGSQVGMFEQVAHGYCAAKVKFAEADAHLYRLV